GGVEEYLQRRADRATAGSSAGGAGAGGSTSGASRPGAPGRAGPATEQAGGPPSAAAQRAARKELQRLERQLSKVGDREARLTAALAEAASDYARLIELGAELHAVQGEKTRLEEQWLGGGGGGGGGGARARAPGGRAAAARP